MEKNRNKDICADAIHPPSVATLLYRHKGLLNKT
jgi:hypothetical protein